MVFLAPGLKTTKYCYYKQEACNYMDEMEKKFIRKLGFSPTKSFLITLGAWFAASTVGNTGLTLQGYDTGLGLRAAGIVIVFGTLISFIVAGIGNILRRIMWNKNGYKGTPVVMGFALNSDGKTAFTSDFFLTFESMLPKDLLEDICSEPGTVGGSDIVYAISATEKLLLIFDSLVLGVVALIFFFLGLPVVGACCIFGIMFIHIITRTRGKTFHGANVQAKYYKEGLGIYYVLRQAAAMDLPLDNLMEEFSDMEMEYYDDIAFTYFSLIDWQGIFLAKAVSEDGKPQLDDVLMSFAKNERMRNFPYRKLTVTRMKLNLNDIYMCYLLRHGTEKELTEMIEVYYNRVSAGAKGAGAKLQKELSWRADLVSGEEVNIKAFPLFRPVEFLKYFPEYQSNVAKLNKLIEGELE